MRTGQDNLFYPSSEAVVERLLLKRGIEDDDELDRVHDEIRAKARETMVKNEWLLKATEEHARRLSVMYGSAKAYNQGVYSYV